MLPVFIFDFYPNRYVIQELEDEVAITKGIFNAETMVFEKSLHTDTELRIAVIKSALKSQQTYVLMCILIVPFFIIYLLAIFTKVFDNDRYSFQISRVNKYYCE